MDNENNFFFKYWREVNRPLCEIASYDELSDFGTIDEYNVGAEMLAHWEKKANARSKKLIEKYWDELIEIADSRNDEQEVRLLIIRKGKSLSNY